MGLQQGDGAKGREWGFESKERFGEKRFVWGLHVRIVGQFLCSQVGARHMEP